MSSNNLKSPQERYTPEDVDRALTQLVLNGGQITRTAEQLGIPKQTLWKWKTVSHADRLNEIATKYAPELERRTIANMQEVIAQSIEGTQEAIQAARAQLKAGETKDPASTARNLATVAGITTDKVLTLQGRPNQITEHRNTEQLLQGLERLAPHIVPNLAEPHRLDENTGQSQEAAL